MPHLAGLFDRRTQPESIPGVIEKMAEAIDLAEYDYACRRWHDSRFGAVNLLHGEFRGDEQPARTGNGKRVLFLDGEIYNLASEEKAAGLPVANCEELTQAESCLRLYEVLGPQFVVRLNGHFNIAIYDSEAEVLRLYNDRFADRPIYFRNREGVFYFAQEQKAILAAMGATPAVDEQGFLELLSFGHFLGDRTLFEGITALPQGTMLTADRNGIRLEKYWRPDFRRERCKGGMQDAGSELAERMVRATSRRAHRKAPLGVFLSGGLDSRFIAGALARSTTDVTAFTHGPNKRDMEYGCELAAQLGFRHRMLWPVNTPPEPETVLRAVWRNECVVPFTDSLSILHHDTIQRDARVIFNGHVGDALSGGHLLPQLFLLKNRQQLVDHIVAKRTFLAPERVRRLVRPDVFSGLQDRLRDSVAETLKPLDEERLPFLYMLWDLTVRQRRYTLPAATVDRYLFEQLSPFLDNEVHEFALTLPLHWLFGQRCYVSSILTAFPNIAKVPWARTGRPIERNFAIRFGRLTGEYVWRKAKALTRRNGVSQPAWTRDSPLQGSRLREMIEGYLDSPHFADSVLDAHSIRELICEHFEANTDHSAEMALLLTLAAGSRLFLNEPVHRCPPEALPIAARLELTGHKH